MNLNGVPIPEHVIQGTPTFTACTPADATVLSNVRSILCTVTGTLQAKNGAGATVAIIAQAGVVYPIAPIAVMTATTGTYVLLY